MGEAANKIIDWKRPDFIDINFGCPVKKVVSNNGGSSLLKDCPLLAATARGIVQAVGHRVPVTAKIRVGWDMDSINAEETCRILESEGIASIAIHGRTRSQGYSGEANWDIIDAAARAVNIPVIGNGDITSGADLAHRKATSAVAGAMIGRAAMQNPWVFQEAKHYLATGETLPPLPVEKRWPLILRHCRLAVSSNRYGDERHTLMAMRSRLMAYSKGFPGSKALRKDLSQIESVAQLEDLASQHLNDLRNLAPI
jgi:tRNA-dihydrouridine synthase B